MSFNPAARLLFVCYFFPFVFVVRSCFSGEPKQSFGRVLVDHKLVQAPPPSNFIAGRPKAALQFCGGFRCGVPLFIVILVIY